MVQKAARPTDTFRLKSDISIVRADPRRHSGYGRQQSRDEADGQQIYCEARVVETRVSDNDESTLAPIRGSRPANGGSHLGLPKAHQPRHTGKRLSNDLNISLNVDMPMMIKNDIVENFTRFEFIGNRAGHRNAPSNVENDGDPPKRMSPKVHIC